MDSGILSSGFGSAVTGFSAGSAFGPIGGAIGGGIGLLSGLASGAKANKLDKAYNAAEANIQEVDPNQAAFLQRLKQQERNFRSGTDASSAYAMQNVRNAGIQNQRNFLMAGGPGVVSNLLRSQQLTNQGVAGIGAYAASGADRTLQMQGGLIDNIAGRVNQRRQEIRNQAMERAVSQRQNNQNTFQGALAMIPGIAAGFSGAGKMNPGSMPGTASQINASLPTGRMMSPATSPAFGTGRGMFPSSTYAQAPQFGMGQGMFPSAAYGQQEPTQQPGAPWTSPSLFGQ